MSVSLINFLGRDNQYSRCSQEKIETYKKIRDLVNQMINQNSEDSNRNFSLYMIDSNGIKKEVTLIKMLGKGGSKKVFETHEGQALALPNMDIDSIDEIARRWERMVNEEVSFSQLHPTIGLLSVSLEKVNVTVDSSDSEAASISAYKTETFQSLAKKGLFVIDNKQGTAWQGTVLTNAFNNEGQLIEDKLGEILQPLLEDAKKIIVYNLPNTCDSLNLAIVEKTRDEDSPLEKDYTVRYFGFDFSKKYGCFSGNLSLEQSQQMHKVFHELLTTLLRNDKDINEEQYRVLSGCFKEKYSIEYIHAFISDSLEIEKINAV